jgi:hypothetical protein
VAVSLFILAVALLAWRWPIAALVVTAVLVEELLTRGTEMSTWTDGQPTPSRTHPCPVTGCTNTVVNDKLLCWLHWQYVPKAIKKQVYDSWNEGWPTSDHVRHCNDARLACERAVKVSSN